VRNARLRITLGVGLTVGVAALAVTFSHSPISVARANVAEHTLLETTPAKIAACQSDEVLPGGISALRLRAYAFTGPRVTVQLFAGGHLIAHGERGSGWTGGAVTVPVNPLPRTTSGVTLCFTFFSNGYESGQLVGEPTSGPLAARGAGGSVGGRVMVEYLQPGRSSWWSLARTVARRMGLGHAWSGSWSVLLVLALMGGVVAACSRAILRGFE
jgi:hypothetical protein